MRSETQIAVHITQECIGDNCECCDWSDEDRAALESMSIVRAAELAFGPVPFPPFDPE